MDFERKFFNDLKEREKKYKDILFEASPPDSELATFGEEDKAELSKLLKNVGVIVTNETPFLDNKKVVWNVVIKDKKQDQVTIIFQNDIAEGVYISTESYLFNNDSLVLIKQIVAYAEQWKSNWEVRLQQFS